MKIQFNEWEGGADFSLEPETVEELAQLTRLALNVSAEKPEMYLSIKKDPSLYIYLKKRKPSAQKLTIKNH